MISNMNWKTIIADIQKFGKLTQAQIAEKCGTKQATVSDLVNGKTANPNYALGSALMTLLDSVKAAHQSEVS